MRANDRGGVSEGRPGAADRVALDDVGVRYERTEREVAGRVEAAQGVDAMNRDDVAGQFPTTTRLHDQIGAAGNNLDVRPVADEAQRLIECRGRMECNVSHGNLPPCATPSVALTAGKRTRKGGGVVDEVHSGR